MKRIFARAKYGSAAFKIQNWLWRRNLLEDPVPLLDRFLWLLLMWTPLAFLLRWRLTCNDSGAPYLLRLYLTPRRDDPTKQFWPSVYLHFFFASDSDREVHNHPWRKAWSLILTGGYREERIRIGQLKWRQIRSLPLIAITDVHHYRPGQINRLTRKDFHRVSLLTSGCWTLFVTWDRRKRDKSWGFYDPATQTFEWSEDRENRQSRTRHYTETAQ